jgi:phage terminase large subunit-like protein
MKLPMPKKAISRAEQYITDVLVEKIVASKLVRLACKRHRHDLADGYTRNLKFRRAKAEHIITFIESFCHHSQGEWIIPSTPWSFRSRASGGSS